jgi:hypothetical protein
MKIGKLKKRTVKELEKLGDQIDKMRMKINDRFDKMLNLVDDAIGHIETLAAEKKSKKVKQIPSKSTIAKWEKEDKKAKKG